MIKKLFQSLAEKVGIESWLLSPDKLSKLLFYLLILFLPTQLGKHFWPQFSFVYGIRLDYLSPTLYFTDILIILIFILSFTSIVSFFKKTSRKYLLFYILLIISLIFPLPFSKNQLAGYYGVLKILELTFLFTYVYFNFQKFDKKLLTYFFCIGIIFESLVSIMQYINSGSIGGILYFFGERSFNAQTPGIANASISGQLILRTYGTFSHPNVLAGYQLITMILILIISFKQKINQKIISLALLMGSISIILTLSRVVLILWVIFMFFLFGLFLKEKYKKTISNSQVIQSFMKVLFLVSLTLVVLFSTPLFPRLFSTNVIDESVTQRHYLIDQSIKMIIKNPIFGVGVNNFYNNLSFVSLENKPPIIQPVHNIFLLLISEIGILGILFLSYLVYLCFIFFRKPTHLRNYFLILFLIIFIIGMFDHYLLTLQQGQLLFTVILATSLFYVITLSKDKNAI